MKRAVITGPTGAVGTALISELIKQKIEVAAVVRPGSKRIGNIPESPLVHIIECDLADLKSLPDKLDGADVFYHFGWKQRRRLVVRHLSEQDHRQNMDVLKAALKLAHRHFLKMATALRSFAQVR